MIEVGNKLNIKDLLNLESTRKADLLFDPKRDMGKGEWQGIKDFVMVQDHPHTFTTLAGRVKTMSSDIFDENEIQINWDRYKVDINSDRYLFTDQIDGTGSSYVELFVFSKQLYPEAASLALDDLSVREKIEQTVANPSISPQHLLFPKLLFPDLVIEPNVYEFVKNRARDELERSRNLQDKSIFASRAASAKVVFSELRIESPVTPEEIEQIQESMYMRMDANIVRWNEIIEMAFNLSLIVAEKIDFMKNGFELVMPKEKKGIHDINPMPNLRRF